MMDAPRGHSSRKKSSAAQATEVTDADGKPDDAVEPMREQVGGHLRNGEQRNDQHDAHHAQACHDGKRNEHHQCIFEYLHRNALRAGKLPVESHVDDRWRYSAKNSISSRASPPNRAMSLQVIVRMLPKR